MPADLRKSQGRDSTAPILGNPDGNITLTEFLDYNCPAFAAAAMLASSVSVVLKSKRLTGPHRAPSR